MSFMNEMSYVDDKLDIIYANSKFPIACSRMSVMYSDGFALMANELDKTGFYYKFIELLEDQTLSI